MNCPVGSLLELFSAFAMHWRQKCEEELAGATLVWRIQHAFSDLDCPYDLNELGEDSLFAPWNTSPQHEIAVLIRLISKQSGIAVRDLTKAAWRIAIPDGALPDQQFSGDLSWIVSKFHDLDYAGTTDAIWHALQIALAPSPEQKQDLLDWSRKRSAERLKEELVEWPAAPEWLVELLPDSREAPLVEATTTTPQYQQESPSVQPAVNNCGLLILGVLLQKYPAMQTIEGISQSLTLPTKIAVC